MESTYEYDVLVSSYDRICVFLKLYAVGTMYSRTEDGIGSEIK